MRSPSFNGQREGLAFVVGAAFAGGDDFALLRLVFGAVGDDDAAASGGCFFDATDQNAVVKRAKFSHGCLLLSSLRMVDVNLCKSMNCLG
jgi:hypothetical protein